MAKPIKGILTSTVVALALLASALANRVDHGTFVVEVSSKGNYVVAAAESRDVRVGTASGLDDRSCKIVALGGDTLFFGLGATVIGVHQGKSWNAVDVARASYRESKRSDAERLSVTWGNKAMQWFFGNSQQDLRSVAEGPDGRIVTGGFIKFEDNGTPSVQSQAIFYSVATNSLTRRAAFQPPRLGQYTIDGTGRDLAKEFFDGKTERAIKAWGPDGSLFDCCGNPTIDSDVVRRSVQFAIENSTGKEKRSLGGPIDIAILRKNRTIDWVSRKTECYALDLKPTGTKAPLKQE